LKCPIWTGKKNDSEFAVLWFRRGEIRPFYVYYSDQTAYSAFKGQKHSIDKKEKVAFLELSKVDTSDATTYICQVNYEEINSPKKIHVSRQVFELSVEARPSIISDPKQYFYVSLGESITLKCGIKGSPQPDIHWYKNGKAIEQTENLVFYKNRTELSISAFLPENSGNYTCSALNRLGSAHHTVWVSHKNFLLPVQPPNNITVKKGDEAGFWCSASSGVGPVSYSWLINGMNFSDVGYQNERLELRDSGQELLFKSTVEKDAGIITCVAKNNETQLSMAAELSIGYPAAVILDSADMQAFIGDDIVLPCHISADPPVEFTNWYKDSILYEPPFDEGYMLNGSLLLKSVTEEDSGVYTCEPFNILGNEGGMSKPFSLIVEFREE